MTDEPTQNRQVSVAVLIPCVNEVATVGKVVSDFRRYLPSAEIYVYDNNSTDGTREVAARAGAVVRREMKQGKGNVVRRMFRDVEADVYIMVDGDDTYDPERAPDMVRMLVEESCDFVNGVRKAEHTKNAYRPGHQIGNRMLTRLVRIMFGTGITDMLSGYKALSRRFVKSFPILASGFEIETELAIHALELSVPTAQLDVVYRPRRSESMSKLRTYRDGFHILLLIVGLVKQERPILFFSIIGAVLALGSIVLAIPIFITFINTGLVPRFPTAILATGLMVLAWLSFFSGIILDTVSRGRLESKMLHYLSTPNRNSGGSTGDQQRWRVGASPDNSKWLSE